jgi:NADH-quinone oxidoreductase subunit L
MWPLYVLAALAALGGLLGVPQFWGDMMGIEQSDSLGNFLSGVLASGGPHDLEPRTAWQLIGSALAASGLGLGIAYLLYVARPELRDKLADSIPFFRRALSRRDWVDAVHAALFVRLPLFVSDQLFRRVEVWLFEGVLVQGTATVVRGLASHGLKHLQSGLTQGYLLVMVAGAIATLVYLAG